ncbi:hypothetical protein BDV96DRAFT_645426 [Lophiotrema nucula]|uniref:Uncharacterized protein n=1 Tax=Lophiotrema nucula TaxID=690887 RepID=A0A6A5Z977_9PLEO|nr:hypothetical protein BDV96DRAFT_645426 [Lophiotrema nucula]
MSPPYKSKQDFWSQELRTHHHDDPLECNICYETIKPAPSSAKQLFEVKSDNANDSTNSTREDNASTATQQPHEDKDETENTIEDINITRNIEASTSTLDSSEEHIAVIITQ